MRDERQRRHETHRIRHGEFLNRRRSVGCEAGAPDRFREHKRRHRCGHNDADNALAGRLPSSPPPLKVFNNHFWHLPCTFLLLHRWVAEFQHGFGTFQPPKPNRQQTLPGARG